MFDSVTPLLAEHRELTQRLADPAVHGDPALARRLGRRFAELGAVVAAHEALEAADAELADAQELASEPGEDGALFAAELPGLRERAEAARERLRRQLIPRDPDDARDVIVEVKAGEGGAEAALFASDLVRMYLRFAETRGWKSQVLSATDSDLGGYKDIQIAFRGSGSDPAEGVFATLKFEGGVHRVQRVPVTESQGRIHTSAAGVLVLPEVDEPDEVQIDANDLKVDVFRSSGPGGQSVNTTDSAVRLTHLPTGIVVSMQNEKSQIQNREAALRVLRSRLLDLQRREREEADSAARQQQVRTLDRSERVRTYNFPENRITDHRSGYKAYNLDAVLDGALGPVVASLQELDESQRLAALAEG
ncbi:MAG: peptide chain release factor 1 [Micrococcus sp.]|nr:peptide chain release factor 1 [Micrococcus sp.]